MPLGIRHAPAVQRSSRSVRPTPSELGHCQVPIKETRLTAGFLLYDV